MSCATLSQGLVGLNVSMASLPEGFCPTSMQDLANAIAARLVVTPNTSSSSFAIGSVPPTSNVGPWFKDCEEWFKFDDATATYVPLKKQGFDNMQYFPASGTFIVPVFISKIKVTSFGGGGGGHTSGGASSGGGGGSFGLAIKTVLPGQAIPIVVGSGGAAAANGGATTILGMSAGGGGGGTGLTTPGVGGVATGFDVNFTGQTGEGDPGGGSTHGGIGGSAAGWGGGGGVAGNAASVNGVAPGGGGAGSTPSASGGGSGASGGVLIEW